MRNHVPPRPLENTDQVCSGELQNEACSTELRIDSQRLVNAASSQGTSDKQNFKDTLWRFKPDSCIEGPSSVLGRLCIVYLVPRFQTDLNTRDGVAEMSA